MTKQQLPVGSFVRLAKPALEGVVEQLKSLGYRTIGPRLAQAAVVYDELDKIDDLPVGWIDEQDGGYYRLNESEDAGYFDYVVGPHSLKQFLFPPREAILQGARRENTWRLEPTKLPEERLAVLGVRGCDLAALRIQDRVFLEGPYVDPYYQARRENLFVVAVNCRRAAATCFCHSMNTGPAVSSGFDLALTERDDQFVVQVGSERGGEVIAAAEWTPCSIDEIHAAQEVPRQLERELRQRDLAPSDGDGQAPRPRSLETNDIRDLLMSNLEHPRWEQVAQRCLACGNCTMVCPTCFCSTVEDVADLTGEHVVRERSWASCFTAEHSYMNSGTVRKTTQLQYRQWLTHKLATWIDQFDVSGCTGCGRCITWCPVGIDLTEEVAAIREDST